MYRHPHNQAPRTFYVADGVLVTDTWIIVKGRRLPVADLRRLRVSRSPRSGVPTFLAIVATIYWLAALLVVSLQQPLGMSAALGLLVASGFTYLAAAAWRRLRRPSRELWADYQGATVLLFASRDARVFGQIRRAVMRSHERRHSRRRRPETRATRLLPPHLRPPVDNGHPIADPGLVSRP